MLRRALPSVLSRLSWRAFLWMLVLGCAGGHTTVQDLPSLGNAHLGDADGYSLRISESAPTPAVHPDTRPAVPSTSRVTSISKPVHLKSGWVHPVVMGEGWWLPNKPRHEHQPWMRHCPRMGSNEDDDPPLTA